MDVRWQHRDVQTTTCPAAAPPTAAAPNTHRSGSSIMTVIALDRRACDRNPGSRPVGCTGDPAGWSPW